MRPIFESSRCCFLFISVLTLHSVTSYSTSSASLHLGQLQSHGAKIIALVDVKLLLETLTSEITRIGEHVNVIGYITAMKRHNNMAARQERTSQVYVQALMIWSTGPMDLQKYEQRVKDQSID